MPDVRGAAAPESVKQTRDKAANAPHPDDPRKPDSPTDMSRPAWFYAAKRAVSEFSKDKVTDLAAGLTFFSVLSLFPMLLAVVSLLGVFGQGERTAETLNEWIAQFAPEDVSELLSGPISGLATQSGAGLALVTGILGALWASSGYVGAFSRAMNRIYEVEEGRPFWKHKPQMLLLTVAIVVIIVLVVVALVLSGPVARSIGNLIGIGETTVLIWNIAKWPVVVALAVVAIAMLYYFSPNVKQPRFRWVSLGAVIALVTSAIAVALFSVYVTNFASYNATYGVIGSVIVLLLGLWIINTVLLLGAEIDAEIERGRQLQGGLPAEETIQLPPRETTAAEKLADRNQKLVDQARELRADPEDRQSEADKDRKDRRRDVPALQGHRGRARLRDGPRGCLGAREGTRCHRRRASGGPG